MTPAEASRQYQAALEAERRARTLFNGITSADDELTEAAIETSRAYQQLDRVRTNHQFAQLTRTLGDPT